MPQSCERTQILIVDDDVMLARVLARVVKASDREVELAHDVASGCSFMRAHRVDVLVCDYELPDGEGRDVLRCALQHQPDAPRILLTGHADWEVAGHAVNDGEIHRVLQKPCDVTTFRATVDEALGLKLRRDGQRELQRMGDDYARELVTTNVRLRTDCATREIELRRQTQELTEALLGAAELRRKGVRHRAHELASLTSRLAAALRLDVAHADDLHTASLLHECGIVALDDRQLRDQELGLDDHSLRIAEASAQIASNVSSLRGAARLIRHLHASTAATTLDARILQAAVRYRRLIARVSPARARTALERDVGTTLDAETVSALVACEQPWD